MVSDLDELLSEGSRNKGFSLREPDYNILELLHKGEVVAMFRQTVVDLSIIKQATEAYETDMNQEVTG